MSALPRPDVRPLGRVEYDTLVGAGLLEGEHVELLDGEMVRVSPQGPAHAQTLRNLIRLLAPVVAQGWDLDVQMPIAATADSEPEPDVAIRRRGDYSQDHPPSADLVIEVSVSSLPLDRTRKARIYAAAGVKTYWIVDVGAREVIVCTVPHQSRRLWRSLDTRRPGDRLTAPGGIRFDVGELFT